MTNCDAPDAILLVGGKGTRLRSIVDDRPKPLASVAGRPFLEWIILALQKHGVHRIVFATGYMGHELRSQLLRRDSLRIGIDFVFSHEAAPLGTAGAVINALPHVRTPQVLVLNGDSLCQFDLQRMLFCHNTNKALATLWALKSSDNQEAGRIEVTQGEEVVAFREKPTATRGGLTSAGIYVIQRTLFSVLPVSPNTYLSLEFDIFPALVGKGLYAVSGPEPLVEIGTPAAYHRAQRTLHTILCSEEGYR